MAPPDEMQDLRQMVSETIDRELGEMHPEDQGQIDDLKKGLDELISTVQSTTEPIVGVVNARLTLIEQDIETLKTELKAFEGHLVERRKEQARDFILILQVITGAVKCNPAWYDKLLAIADGRM